MYESAPQGSEDPPKYDTTPTAYIPTATCGNEAGLTVSFLGMLNAVVMIVKRERHLAARIIKLSNPRCSSAESNLLKSADVPEGFC